jgi:cell wall-associated NlpC family hydrolase
LTSTPQGDGEDPTVPGYTDEYLAQWERMQESQASVAAAQATLDAAETVRDSALAARSVAQMEMNTASIVAAATATDSDQVVRQVYMDGTGGLGAIGAVLDSPPESALQTLSDAYLVTSVATGTVREMVSARQAQASAEASLLIAESRLRAAEDAVTLAQDAVTAAQEQYGLTSEEFGLLLSSAAAPQTQVGPDGCPVEVPVGTLRGGAETIGVGVLCRQAVKQAATPQAAAAIKWAFTRLGAPYACKGVGRMGAWRFDCSSLVSRAYYEGAGIKVAGDTWAPSTRNMVPWDGIGLDPHYAQVAPGALRPGDLVLYDTGGTIYRHVVMYLGSPDGGKTFWMLHTNSCGDVAKVEPFWGVGPDSHALFLVARRVVTLPGEKVVIPATVPSVGVSGEGRVTAEPGSVRGR